MTGDGANDSAALKAGDIGISIAARESSASNKKDLSAEEVRARNRTVSSSIITLLLMPLFIILILIKPTISFTGLPGN
jgi:P-type E1-E2 ATPase